MKIKAILSIGYYGADREDILEIPDEELEGLTDDEKEAVYEEYVEEWANEYIDTGWEKIE